MLGPETLRSGLLHAEDHGHRPRGPVGLVHGPVWSPTRVLLIKTTLNLQVNATAYWSRSVEFQRRLPQNEVRLLTFPFLIPGPGAILDRVESLRGRPSGGRRNATSIVMMLCPQDPTKTLHGNDANP